MTPTTTPPKSRKVSALLRLYDKRDRLEAKYDKKMQAVRPVERALKDVRAEIIGRTLMLTGAQKGELERAIRARQETLDKPAQR